MFRATVLFSVLYGIWLILSGHYSPRLLILGALCSLGIVLLSRRMGILDEEGVPVGGVTLRFFAYLPWLAWAMVVSSVQVTRVVLAPSLPIDPRIIRFRGRPRTPIGRYLYANSITITPGTNTMSLDEKFTVHSLIGGSGSEMEEDSMGRKVAWVEGTQ